MNSPRWNLGEGPGRGSNWGVKYGLILLVFFHPLFIPYSHSTPSGLGPLPGPSPGCTWGYSHSTPSGLGPLPGPSPGCTWGYSHSTLSGLGPPSLPSPGCTWGYSHSTLSGLGPPSLPSPGFTCGYSHSTLSGLARPHTRYHRFHLWLFTFNPFRVGTSPHTLPQVSLKLLSRYARNESFTFNPYGVGAFPGPSPGCTCGYSHFQAKVSATETLAWKPLRGCLTLWNYILAYVISSFFIFH